MNVFTFSDHSLFVASCVDFIKNVVDKKSGIVQIALSGGSTPQPIYEALSKRSDIPFERIEFFIVDERYVPLDNTYSNFRMIQTNLINKIQNNIAGFFHFDTSLPIKDALQKYENDLPEQFDLVILGIGLDGHIASLFPNSLSLHEKGRKTAHTKTNSHSVKDRLTITFPPILKSKQILVLLQGNEKKSLLEKLENYNKLTHDEAKKNWDDFPAAYLLGHDNLYIYYGPST